MNILGIIIILVKGGAPEGDQKDKMEVTLSGIRTFRDLSGLETAFRDVVRCSAHTLRTWSTHEFHRFRKFQDDPTSITIKIHGFSILGSSKILKKAPNIHERVL